MSFFTLNYGHHKKPYCTLQASKLFAVISLIVLMGCSDKNTSENIQSCYKNTNARTIIHDNTVREFIVYTPPSYDGTVAVPLMINFHGFGGIASDYFLEADMRSLAESKNMILVYPQGSCLDGSPHWNACPNGNDNKSNTDDFDFIEKMIETISSEYIIDSERIYATGYSNGGMMAFGLANYKSDLIAAVASVSGTMLDCTNSTNRPMPILMLHGTADTVIPYNGNAYFNSVDTTINYWTVFNNTSTEPVFNSYTDGNTTIEHYTYNQGLDGVSVEYYKFINGEHVWFNNSYQNLNTAELIYKFVSKYDINGLR